LLGGCVAAALHPADTTDGLVDPTVGQAVAASGYGADLSDPAYWGAAEGL
jgi:hypothetical protein